MMAAEITSNLSIFDPFVSQKIDKLMNLVNELSDDLETVQENHADALQRITILEKNLNGEDENISIQTKEQQRALQLLKYLKSHDGITTNTAMKLLKLSHHQSALRVMKSCAEKNNNLFFSKTTTGKRILKVKTEVNR